MAKAAIAIFLLLVSSVVTAAEKPAESTLLPTSPTHVHPPLRSITGSLPGFRFPKPPIIRPRPFRPHPPHNLPPPPTAYSYISFEGFVSVKSCKDANSRTIPVPGAVVRLQCNGDMLSQAPTVNGYFYLEAPKYINANGPHNCTVFVRAPNSALYTPPILNSGANLMTVRQTTSYGDPFLLYNVGTLAFCSTLN